MEFGHGEALAGEWRIRRKVEDLCPAHPCPSSIPGARAPLLATPALPGSHMSSLLLGQRWGGRPSPLWYLYPAHTYTITPSLNSLPCSPSEWSPYILLRLGQIQSGAILTEETYPTRLAQTSGDPYIFPTTLGLLSAESSRGQRNVYTNMGRNPRSEKPGCE